jgi:hypothetical protein
MYRDPAPAVLASTLYGVGRIPTLSVVSTNGKQNEKDLARAPDHVMLLAVSDFDSASPRAARDASGPRVAPSFPAYSPFAPASYSPVSPWFAAGLAYPYPGLASPYADRSRSPAFRAVWNGAKGLRKGERGTIFGFTSNEPPTFADVRIRGLGGRRERVDVKVNPNGEPVRAATAAALANGEVPTPVGEFGGALAVGAGALPLGGTVGSLGPLGGLGVPGGIGGVGGFGPGFGGVPGVGGVGVPVVGTGGFPGGGTGSGGGSGGGNGNNRGNQNQNQNQQQGGTSNQQPINVTVNQSVQVNQSQNQNQNQSQKQIQKQKQQQSQNQQTSGGPGGEVVPEPAAVILALIGLPFLLLVARRKVAAGARV